MNDSSNSIEILWSYWDANPTVAWTKGETSVSVRFERPPVEVANLDKLEVIGIVASGKEFGAANLLFYSYDGSRVRTFTAPQLGRDAQFCRVEQRGGDIRVAVQFYLDHVFKEQAGRLNLEDGSVTGLHRNY